MRIRITLTASKTCRWRPSGSSGIRTKRSIKKRNSRPDRKKRKPRARERRCGPRVSLSRKKSEHNMGIRLDRRNDGWFLDGVMLPGIDVKATQSFRQYGYWADKTLGDLIEEAARNWPKKIALAIRDRRGTNTKCATLSS